MPRDGRGCEPEHFGDLTYTEFIVFHQSGNHPQPITVSQGFCRIKRSFHLFIRWLTISGFWFAGRFVA
jgi:hypothetical protein